MKKVIYLMAVAMVFSLTTVSAENNPTEGDDAKLYALKFHADYCGACKALTPSLTELHSKLEGEGVEFVKFDFTSAESKKKSEKIASELGVSDIYKDNQGTGFVLLVDAESKETVGKLTSQQSVDDMYTTIKKNL